MKYQHDGAPANCLNTDEVGPDLPCSPPAADRPEGSATQAAGQNASSAGDASNTPLAGPMLSAAGGTARRGLVPVLAFTGIAVAAMQTLTVPIVAELPRLLNTTSANAAWVITATLLSGTVAAPIMGRLGDLYGKRRILLVTLSAMVMGSLLSGFTSELVPMVAGRALQGIALGAIPLGIGIIWEQLPPEKRSMAIAFMSSSVGVGGALAIPLAAFIAQNFDWHWLFFGTTVLGSLAMAAIFAVVREGQRGVGRFDVIGALGLVLGLTTLLLVVSKGSEWGWASVTTVGLLVTTVAILVAWGLFELRSKDPLLNLRTAVRRPVLLTNLAAITVGLAFFAVTLVLPQLLQLPKSTGYGMGLSMVVAGVCGAVMGLAMMAVAPLAGRLTETHGPKVTLITGLVLLAVAYLAGMVLLSAVWQVVLVAALAGAGVGTAYAAMPTIILDAVDPAESGAANGLNALMRSVGTSISSAVIGAVIAGTTQRFGAVELPTLEGFRMSFVIAAGAALVGLILAAFLPGRTRSHVEMTHDAPAVCR